MKTFFKFRFLWDTTKSLFIEHILKNKGGRPDDTEQLETFQNTCTYFELKEKEQSKLPDLIDIM